MKFFMAVRFAVPFCHIFFCRDWASRDCGLTIRVLKWLDGWLAKFFIPEILG